MTTAQIYSMRDTYLVSTDGGSISTPFFLRDSCHWKGFDEQDIKMVFDNSRKELIEKLEQFKNFKGKPTLAEERELVFLLETLLQSRRLFSSTQQDEVKENS